MRVTFTHRATEGERFAPDAFDTNVGKSLPVTLNGDPLGVGTLRRATVAADGLSVLLEVEIGDPAMSVTVPLDRFGEGSIHYV